MTAAVRVGGLDIAYERAGDGPPLVLLHGILCDRRVWRYQLFNAAVRLFLQRRAPHDG